MFLLRISFIEKTPNIFFRATIANQGVPQVCVCACVCISQTLSLLFSSCFFASVSDSQLVYIFLFVFLSLYLPSCLLACLSVCLPACLPPYLPLPFLSLSRSPPPSLSPSLSFSLSPRPSPSPEQSSRRLRASPWCSTLWVAMTIQTLLWCLTAAYVNPVIDAASGWISSVTSFALPVFACATPPVIRACMFGFLGLSISCLALACLGFALGPVRLQCLTEPDGLEVKGRPHQKQGGESDFTEQQQRHEDST